MGVDDSMATLLSLAFLTACCTVVTAQEECIVNGSIEFSPLPSRSPPLSSHVYDDEGLQPIVDLSNSFINTVHGDGPPYELINRFLDDLLKDSNSSKKRRSVEEEQHSRQRRATFLGISVGGESETIDDIIDYETPFIVAFVIGLLWAFLTLIIGCVFGCCRMCGNCGGSLVYDGEDKHATLKRWLLILFLTTFLILVFVGCICAFVANQRMSDSVARVNDEVQDAISDIYNFVDDTIRELKDIVFKKFPCVVDAIKEDIRGIAKSLGKPILDEFRVHVEPAVQSVLDMADRISATQLALVDVNKTVETLLDYGFELEKELNVTKDNLTTLIGNCRAEPTLASICGRLPNVDILQTGADFTRVPNIGVEVQKVEEVLNIDPSLKELAQQGNQTFEDIPQTVENKTASTESEIDTQTDDYRVEVETHVTTVNDTAYKVLDDDLSLQDIRSHVRDGAETAVEFDKYRYGVGIALCVMVLLVVTFGVLGVTCGVLNFDSEAPPNKRPRGSDQSATCLMVTVGMVIVFSFFLLVLASICFFVGANVKILCDPLVDLDFFVKTVDNPTVADGYFLSRIVLDDDTVDLTLSGMLRACENDQSLWQALKLNRHRKLNLTKELDFESIIPQLEDSFQNLTVNINEVEILPQSARQNLEDFQNTGVDDIDFDQYTAQIETNLLLFDINETVANLTAVATLLQLSGQYELGNNSKEIADQLARVQRDVVQPATVAKDELKVQVSVLRVAANDTRDAVGALLNSTDSLQDFLHEDGADIIKEEVDEFKDRILGYVRDFVDQALVWIQDDIGHCENIHAVYSSATTFMCRDALDGLNGFWVSIGWCTFFMFFVMILSINLAYHFRRLGYSAGFDSEEEGDFSGVPMEPRGKKPVNDYVSEETSHYPQTAGSNMVHHPNTPQGSW